MGCSAPGVAEALAGQRPRGEKNLGSAGEPRPVTLFPWESCLPFHHSLGGTVFYFLLGKAAFPYLLYESPYPQLVKTQGESTRRCTEKGSASRATATLNQKANYFLCKFPWLLGHIPHRASLVTAGSYGNGIPANSRQKGDTPTNPLINELTKFPVTSPDRGRPDSGVEPKESFPLAVPIRASATTSNRALAGIHPAGWQGETLKPPQ